MKVKLKDIAEILISINEKQIGEIPCQTISPVSLSQNNKINFQIEHLKNCGEILLKENDIVLKRISPTYVCFAQTLPHKKITVLANLIIIRVKDEKIDAKYLGFTIEQYLTKLNKQTNSSTRFSAINRDLINEIEVAICSLSMQNSLGHLWLLAKQKQQLLERLLEKENQKIISIFKQIQKQINGE